MTSGPPPRSQRKDQQDSTGSSPILGLIFLSPPPPSFLFLPISLSHIHLLLNKISTTDFGRWSHLHLNSGRAISCSQIMTGSQSHTLLFYKGCAHNTSVAPSILNQPCKACFALILLKNFEALFHFFDLAV